MKLFAIAKSNLYPTQVGFHRVAISSQSDFTRRRVILEQMLPLEILRALALQVALKNDSEWER